MSYTFERPIGAAADAAELEYVAALHQTQHGEDDGWLDASIEATDVKNFLLSRYGIQVTKREVLDLIFAEMGGGNADDECIDLTEVVAILLIPYFAKISSNFIKEDIRPNSSENSKSVTTKDELTQSHKLQSAFEFDAYLKSEQLRSSALEGRHIVSNVLKIILKNATGSSSLSQPLTPDLLRNMFSYYGERSLLEDNLLVDEMIAAVASYGSEGGGNGGVFVAFRTPTLNVDTFLHAMTYDTRLYDVTNESRFQTHFEDVFGLVTYEKDINSASTHNITRSDDEDDFQDVPVAPPDSETGTFDLDGGRERRHSGVRRIFTFPHIDFLADTFRSRTQYMFVWVSVIVCYLAWFPWASNYGVYVCGPRDDEEGESTDADLDAEKSFGCKVSESIVLWLLVFVTMTGIVVPSVMILNLGNNVYSHSILEILCGILGIGFLVILPSLWSFEIGAFINTYVVDKEKKDDVGNPEIVLLFDIMTLGCGFILLWLQLCNIVRFIVPDSKLTQSKTLTSVLRGSSVRSEFGIKQATVFKIHRMVTNAYDLHKSKKVIQEEGGLRQTFKKVDNDEPSNENALLNFTKITEKREPYGGFKWAWKMVLSGKLIEEEGVWLHTKLLAGNFAHALVTVGTSIAFVILATLIIGSLYVESNTDTAENTASSSQTRRTADDPEECLAFFEPKKCYFPESNGTSAGFAICAGVSLGDPACVDRFKNATGPAFDFYCDIFQEGVEQLPPPASLIYDECPGIYWPTGVVTTVTSDSTRELYCATNLNGCTEPVESYYGTYFDACVIGFGSPIDNPLLITPFNFEGDLCSNYTEMESLLKTKAAIQEGDYYPRKWMLQTSTSIGIISVLLAGFIVNVSTIPSMVITTLQFRSGTIPSLHDPYFKKYRVGLLGTTFLLGASIWGAFITSVVIFVLSFVFTFLSVYQVTRPFVLTFLSLLVGISVTLVLKILISFFLNKYNFVGFYRRHPLVANISSLCFECWHLALTASYVIFRIVKLFVIIIVYAGRYDTPLLAKGVGEIGPIKLDAFPFIFKQDLLAIDAHRHPYIERLGMMYMMKLRHGDNFAKRAGSIWRLLFVFALFPWLRKNRVLDDDDGIDLDIDTEMESSLLQEKMQEKIAALNAKIKRLAARNSFLAKKK